MTALIGLSGSLRRGSFNTALLRTAATLLSADATLDIHTLHGIPLYDADLEASAGLPERVMALKEAIVAADGLLLATPEYNNGIPGVFKNAIDWLSRPASDVRTISSFGGAVSTMEMSLAPCTCPRFPATVRKCPELESTRTV